MTKLSWTIKTDHVTSAGKGRGKLVPSVLSRFEAKERTLETSWGCGSARAVTGGSSANELRKKIEKTDKSVFVSPQKIPTVQVIFIATSTSHST